MKQTNKYIFQFCETESKANFCCFFGGKTVLLEAEGRHFPPKNNNSLPSFLYLFFFEFHIGTIKGGQIKESQEPGDRCSRRRTRSKGHRVAEYIERDAGSRRTCNTRNQSRRTGRRRTRSRKTEKTEQEDREIEDREKEVKEQEVKEQEAREKKDMEQEDGYRRTGRRRTRSRRTDRRRMGSRRTGRRRTRSMRTYRERPGSRRLRNRRRRTGSKRSGGQ